MLPFIILSDNLKSYVSRPDRYAPTFTQLCKQLAAHYHLELQATRVAKPKDKASVEKAVNQAYRQIYAPLRNETFYSLDELNDAIRTQLEELNWKPYQKRASCRAAVFEELEKPAMRPLPCELFEPKKVTTGKVQRNYHVFLGEEKNFYSVPYRYVGKRVEVIYTSDVVEIYLDDKRIALHKRLQWHGPSHRYQTRTEHMPKRHQEWKQAQGYDGAYFLRQAQMIGPVTHWAVQQVLISRIHEAQAFNSCKGILKLADKYTAERLESASRRCQKAGKATYGMLKRILQKGLDQEPDDSGGQLRLGMHENVRGPGQYQ